jgi:hypothetical protein
MDDSIDTAGWGQWRHEWIRAGNGLRLIARLPIPAMLRIPSTNHYVAFLPREWSENEREAQLKLYMWDFWLATFGLEQPREHLREHLMHGGVDEHDIA